MTKTNYYDRQVVLTRDYCKSVRQNINEKVINGITLINGEVKIIFFTCVLCQVHNTENL